MDTFALDVPAGAAPLFARIARAISDDVRRGRLRPGDTLPGSRTLAATLSVHRNTVLSALRELELQGWIETTAARATRIRTELPEMPPRKAERSDRAGPRTVLGFDVNEAPPDVVNQQVPRGSIALLGGLPDLRLLPTKILARAYRRIATAPRSAELFGYGDTRGEEPLRSALAEMVSHARGMTVGADDVVVTRGSQMGLFLCARAILSPGDRVAVEGLGYRPAWEALRAAGAELVPVPVDTSGLVVEALPALGPLRAVYVTPHHQYPTTAVLAPARRMALLELARARRLAVFEDDYDHEFHYEGRPITPLASADTTGQVVYIGTLSKILAPALRIGFVIAPAPVLARIAAHRAIVDRQGDRLMERTIAELAADGEILRHARKMRRVYAARREVLAHGLTSTFGDELQFELPVGGMALWVCAPKIDVEAWARASAARGVVFQTASRFTFDGSRQRAMRLGFAAEPEAKLRAAVRLMADALGDIRSGNVRPRR